MTRSPAPAEVPPRAVSLDRRPGLDRRRLARLMQAAVRRLDLDLSGSAVVTEAATGAYAATPVIAALAGARVVHAVARDSRFGTVADVVAVTEALAEAVGVRGRISIVTSKDDADLAYADIVTNSGHLRPLDRATVLQMRRGAAIPLMYESWELRAGDVDLEACRAHGVRVGGTNERHPAVGVFAFHGVVAARLLTDAGIAVHGARVLLLCDNPFRPFLELGLVGCGANVEVREQLAEGPIDRAWDVILVALQPGPEPVLDVLDAALLAEHAPGTVVAQYWGDVDRDALQAAAVPLWPRLAPAPGHMGILPSAIGPEPVIRLQAAGLKVGELLCRNAASLDSADLDLVQWTP